MFHRRPILAEASSTVPTRFDVHFAKVLAEEGNLAAGVLCQLDDLAEAGDFLSLAAHATVIKRLCQRRSCLREHEVFDSDIELRRRQP